MAIIVPTETKSVLHNETLKGFELVNDETSPGANKVYGTDGAGAKGWKDDPAGGGAGETIYEADDSGASPSGWIVKGTAGITVDNPSSGNYTVTVPAGGTFSYLYKNFTSAGSDFTGGGEVVITINWTSASFNTSKADEVTPTFFLVDSSGTQRNPGDVAVGVTTDSVSGGNTQQTLSNINGLGVPVAIKGII
mgnify:CR=1 FL=1|jgi:hypothetical protein